MTLDAWLDPRRLRLYPRVVLTALVTGWVVAVLRAQHEGVLSRRIGGDFPAFYGAARIVASGDARSIYDWGRQAQVQASLFPTGAGPQMLPFPYPPYTALFYRPLACLPYLPAYVVHTLIMALALALCVHWLRGLAPRVSRYPVEAYALAVTFVPMFMALGGGQPAPLLVCALAAAFHSASRGHGLLAGLCLGALFLKPQYALPWMGLFALGGQWRVALGALAVGGGCYVVAALVFGPGWIPQYLDVLTHHQIIDQRHNAAHSIGFLGVAEALLGPGKPVALIVGWALVAACGAYLVRLWARRVPVPLPLRLAVTAPLVLLLEPHVMHYDAAFLVPTFAVLADRGGRRAIVPLGALYGAALATPLADRIGVSPAFFVVLATAALAMRALGREGPAPEQATASTA